MKKVNISDPANAFDPAKLVTEVKIRNAIRNGATTQSKTIEVTYDGAGVFSMEADLDSFGGYGTEDKESVQVTFPKDGEFLQRDYMAPVRTALAFLRAMDEEIKARYLQQEWFKGSGPSNYGAITGPIHPSTKQPLMQPIDLWHPILKEDEYGASMQLKLYTKNPPPLVCAATGEKLSIQELKDAMYPFKSINRGNGEVAVRTKSKKQWHAVGNPGAHVSIGDHEQTFAVQKVRARVDFRFFGWFIALNGAGLAIAVKAADVFVPFYRGKLLPEAVAKKVLPSGPEPEDCKEPWCNAYVQQLKAYRGTKRKSPEPEVPADEGILEV